MNTKSMLLQYLARFDRPTDCVNALNAVLGTNYDINRLGQWRRGAVPPPGIVSGYLLGLADNTVGRKAKKNSK
jgi:hypothetical protein